MMNSSIKEFNVEITDQKLASLERDQIVKVNITKFERHYTLIPPSHGKQNDPFFYNRLRLFLSRCAQPGGTAASSANSGKSLIREIYEHNMLPDDSELYGLINYYPYLNKLTSFLWLQLDDLYFNDGSLRIIKSEDDYQIFDYPNAELIKQNLASNDYFHGERVIIGTNDRSENIEFIANQENILQKSQEHALVFGISASPLLIRQGKVLTLAQILSSQQIGDPRHYIRIPYTERGPVLLKEFTNLFRFQKGNEIINALHATSLNMPLEKSISSQEVDFIINAFQQDKAYGKDFNITYLTDENALVFPYLKPAPYNHLLFGITFEGELILIQTGGRYGNITGQQGLDLEELLNFLKKIQKEFNIKHLFTGSQGRDTDNIVTGEFDGDELRIHNHTTQGGSFNLGDNYVRGQVTTPRVLIGRME